MLKFLGAIGVVIAVVFGGAFLFAIAGRVTGDAPSSSSADRLAEKAAACADAEAIVRGLGGSPRREWREVQFSPSSWRSLPLDAKRNVVTLIGECLAPSKNSDILDGMSGARIASFRPLGGVTIGD